jgi:uncharacterized membrane protein
MFISSVLRDISAAFNNIYSGWILWNLFLAAVPLFLSFVLFKRQNLSRRKILSAIALMSAIGIAGVWPRLPKVMLAQTNFFEAIAAGDRATQLKVLWWIVLIITTVTMSVFLFKREKSRRTVLWWLGLIAFLAFLPNAPYVLTDIIHLVRATSAGILRPWVIIVIFIPIHAIAILAGFEAYTLSLINQAYYLKQKGNARFILPTELFIHGLSAMGIYLGRFLRFNSWDVATDPTSVAVSALDTLTTKRPAAVVFVTFIILTVLYWVMKQLTLGIKLRLHYRKQGIDALDL